VLPTFLVIGARKAGTVAMYVYLRDHPQVFMSATKELRFFVAERNWDKGLDWYERQFEDAGDAVAVGEATPGYTSYPEHTGVPERIAKVLPEARLVYVVRHPIERMRSDYFDQVLRGAERAPIDQALRGDPGYLDRSRYALQVDQYMEHFPPEQLLVIRSEDLRGARRATLRRVYGFLGVDEGWESPVLAREYHRTAEWRVPRPSLESVRGSRSYRALSRLAPRSVKKVVRPLITRKAGQRAPEIPDDLRKRLADILTEDVRRLRAYMQPDFDGWGLA
jgi:hypothetical protein